MEQSSAFFPMHASTCFWLDLEWQFSTWWINWHENKKSSSGGCSMTCTCAAVARKAFEILSHLWDTLNLQLGDWRCGHFRDHFIRKCLCRVLRHPSFLQSTAKHLASLWNLERRIWEDFLIFFEALVAIMCLIFALFLIPYELHVASWAICFFCGFCWVQNMSGYPAVTDPYCILLQHLYMHVLASSSSFCSVGVGVVSHCPPCWGSSSPCLPHSSSLSSSSQRSRHWHTNHAFCTCSEQCKVISLVFQICFRSIILSEHD